jgi:hypothetical protein
MKAYSQLAFWCRFGHEMTDDNTRLGRSGEPQCKECLRLHLAAVRRRTKTSAEGRPGKEGIK